MAKHTPSSTAKHASTPIDSLTEEQAHKMPLHQNSSPCQKETTPRWGKADYKKFTEYVKEGKTNISNTTPATIETIHLAYFKERLKPTFCMHYRALAASLVCNAKKSR
jgi:hypothetical protein